MSWLCPRAASRSCRLSVSGATAGRAVPPHVAPEARCRLTSTSTWFSSEDELDGGGEGEVAGEPSIAADSVGLVGDTGDPLQAAIDIPVTSNQVATRQPGGRSLLETDR